MRGKLDTFIKGLFPKIVAGKEGWPLVRVAVYRGTTVCNITIILGIFCPENKKNYCDYFYHLFIFHYRGCFFSLSWVSFHYRGCFIDIPYTVMFNMCLNHLGFYRKCLICLSTSVR